MPRFRRRLQTATRVWNHGSNLVPADVILGAHGVTSLTAGKRGIHAGVRDETRGRFFSGIRDTATLAESFPIGCTLWSIPTWVECRVRRR
jgi:hypothetical protein